MIFQENTPIANTFGINAQSRYFAEYENIAELQEILNSDIFRNNKFLHIGAGSNLLFLSDFNGVILHSKIQGITVDVASNAHYADEVFLRVGAGVLWDDFVKYTVEMGFFGAENLSLIPGEVGAAAVQNIGAYGVEAKDIISAVETVEISNGETRIFTNEECRFAYRESVFKGEEKGKYIVTSVTFRLSKTPIFRLDYGNLSECPKDLPTIRETIIKIREEKLPDYKVLGNAGSFFKNPYICIAHYEGLKKHYPALPHYPVNDEVVKIPAAWLIEQCGWKGKSLGNAAVYDKQALVIVNNGNATAQEIKALSDKIIANVKGKFHIDICPEVNFVF
ncbi:UDP-N-acetylenolpyruvoylglucosamine reductase [Bacteroidia bacterium]|nr:UDP-N-acetylenolpyruvoylglucosamine reductase [Bacteroidia bacterium]